MKNLSSADTPPARPEDLSAAVIAGGRSTRFGSPKTEARLRGRPLIEYMLALAAEIAPQTLLIYGREDRFDYLPVSRYGDILPDCGPLGGIHSALQNADSPWVAILPGDMPLLTADVYRCLYARRQKETPVVARSQNGLEPLVSLWPATLAANLEQALKTGQRALHRILTDLKAVELNCPQNLPAFHANIFRNVNRPADLSAIEQLLDRLP